MSDERNLPAVQTAPVRALSAFSDIGSFENAQRMAKALAVSTFVPRDYQNKVENVLVALEVANRTGSSVLAVMQSLNVIYGRPGWSAQYIIASINGSGHFDRLRFRMTGEGDKRQCVAYAKDLETGEIVEGPPCSIAMAKAEGWFSRKDRDGRETSKWQTMPELMLQYRAATFFGRLHVPDVLLGMQTEDELRDVTPDATVSASVPDTVRGINERVKAKAATKKPAAGPVIEGQAVDVEKSAAPGDQETSPEGGFV